MPGTRFIEMTKLRDKLLANNEKIHWIPSHIGPGRFEISESVVDWCLSRERYWGRRCPSGNAARAIISI